MIVSKTPIERIKQAGILRAPIAEDTNAYRLFNGFYEGYPGLILDRFGSTLVVMNHAEKPVSEKFLHEIAEWASFSQPWLTAILFKQRQSLIANEKWGRLLAGDQLSTQVNEFGVSYALDLQMHQDASFYLDTRNLRNWLFHNTYGMRVLNTFAYTGSLGVSAGAGGAVCVVQTDINRKFLALSEQSWKINNLPVENFQTIPGDFFRVTGQLRKSQRLFDCVIVDPPFFSATKAGRVNLAGKTALLINKVRPLVAHEGKLIIINNALFYPGADFMAELQSLCQGEYLSFEEIIPIPPDITGYPETRVNSPPTDSTPFNHPTKIAILKAYRKDQLK